MTKAILCTCLLSLLALAGYAQFQINGAASQLSDSCYRLTPEQNGQAGSIWNLDQISLAQSFDVVMDIFLGCKDDNGADGIVFGFQPVSTSVGNSGGGIGFEGVNPSLGIEFDSYQNGGFGDPSFDHIAIISDGNLNHNASTNLAGPIQASTDSPNIEDCESHELRVTWNATSFTLQVYLDCKLRLTYQGDIVNEIFGGDPMVFWGFTSGTGALNNRHEVCFSYTTFLDQLDDLVLCPNGQVQLNASGGIQYEWSPAEGLDDPNIPNPVASPSETTTYTVSIFDECGIPFYDSLQVIVDGDSSFVELGPDTLFCGDTGFVLDASNPNSVYQWNTGDTTAQIQPLVSGQYIVTVVVDDYCFDSDQVWLDRVDPPFLDLGDKIPVCEGTIQVLEPGANNSPFTEYVWQDGSTNPTFSVQQPGTYSVQATNLCGEAFASISLEYESCREVYFPNAFTPNFDGINDYFHPMDAGDVEVVRVMRVFDRWGNMVFEATDFLPNDISNAWDGTFRGKAMDMGVYVWFADLVFRDGQAAHFEGDLHLVR